MMTTKTMYFVHDGKAAYPAIPAYEKFFSQNFVCASGTLDEFRKNFEPSATVLWYMMGFYPKRVEALMHVHDYRSLSVGTFAGAKDWVKKNLNFRPDVRIYQNQRMREALPFSDGIPEFLIPVGISPVVAGVSMTSETREWDFAYLGAMNKDRQFHKVIESFLRRFGDRRTLALVGPVEEYITTRFKANKNILFFGKKPQDEAYRMLLNAKVCVAYFPYHRPHTFQAPTKLLEYMALGVRILANDAPSNLEALDGAPVNAILATADIFKNCPEPELFPSNEPYIDDNLLWPNFIVNSGVSGAIASAVGLAQVGASEGGLTGNG